MHNAKMNTPETIRTLCNMHDDILCLVVDFEKIEMDFELVYDLNSALTAQEDVLDFEQACLELHDKYGSLLQDNKNYMNLLKLCDEMNAVCEKQIDSFTADGT